MIWNLRAALLASRFSDSFHARASLYSDRNVETFTITVRGKDKNEVVVYWVKASTLSITLNVCNWLKNISQKLFVFFALIKIKGLFFDESGLNLKWIFRRSPAKTLWSDFFGKLLPLEKQEKKWITAVLVIDVSFSHKIEAN